MQQCPKDWSRHRLRNCAQPDCASCETKRAYQKAWELRYRERRTAERRQRRNANPWHFWAEKCIHGNRAAGRKVTITWPQINAMLRAQNYRCALTGIPFWKSPKRRGCASWDSPSLDRIRHGGPYAVGNVRIVLHCVNTFRGTMGDEQMLEIARKLIRGGHRRM
jgi:hypothetical protein